jgi:hypothetical protein
MARPPHKNTKGADHHYFPKALQKFWRNDQGWVSRLSPDGALKHSKTGGFGHIRNAHHVRLADTPTPWDSSFEHTFNAADSAIPAVVALLSQLECPESQEDEDWGSRFTPQWQLDPHRRMIAETVASLVVRSPNLRNGIKVMLNDFPFGGAPPWPGGEPPNHLIAANQRHTLDSYAKALAERGRFVVLLSNCREFIFGDGMLHNFRTGMPGSPHNPRCLVPLTPTVAIAYDCPSSYYDSPGFLCVNLTPKEVDNVNECTMVYSGRHIYFRNELPRDLSIFQIGRHQEFRYHRDDWFDPMMAAATQWWFERA